MTTFLVVIALSVVGVLVSSALLFMAVTRNPPAPKAGSDERRSTPPSQFFADEHAPASPASAVPVRLLVLQIERHVQLEQSAAESYCGSPTAEALHAVTTSPLVH